MKLSASNLAWGPYEIDGLLTSLPSHGLQGIEVAPTALWPDAPDVAPAEVRSFTVRIADLGLRVSGVQSLLYGHPESQLFDRSTWPMMLEHLWRTLDLAGMLGADVAVFGSPRNRLRGDLPAGEADKIAAEFFRGLEPVLQANDLVLTLEPNAPAYGADYLIRYADVVRLSALIDSPWIQPQIDTGCLAMVDDDTAAGVLSHTPAHVHVSAPNLVPPPGGVDHTPVARALTSTGYTGWVVLEMLPAGDDPRVTAEAAMRWLHRTYGGEP